MISANEARPHFLTDIISYKDLFAGDVNDLRAAKHEAFS